MHYEFGKYGCNLYSLQTNKRALKKVHSIRRRYVVHRFWLVHGRVAFAHIRGFRDLATLVLQSAK